MLIWILMAVGLVILVAVSYGGHRRYRNRGGGANNPSSHNAGHAKDHHSHNRRGRGRGH